MAESADDGAHDTQGAQGSGMRAYWEEMIMPDLRIALAEAYREQPAMPIVWLSNWLTAVAERRRQDRIQSRATPIVSMSLFGVDRDLDCDSVLSERAHLSMWR